VIRRKREGEKRRGKRGGRVGGRRGRLAPFGDDTKILTRV
jgi:hypothetical protein